MKRREFLALLGSAPTWSLAARAQQPDRMRRIGVLANLTENDPQMRVRLAAFRQGLERLEWSEGHNIRIDYRFPASTVDAVEQMQVFAKELVALQPDVILAVGTPATAGLRQTTRMVPIVFVVVSEPVAQGFVQSLPHPGGNITGFSYLEPSLGGKWLELLKEIAPRIIRVAFMFNPTTAPNAELFFRSVEAAAPKFAVEAIATRIHGPAEIEAAMTRLGREPGGGVIVAPDVFTGIHRKMVIELAARYRLPAIYGFLNYVAEGGLVSYGVEIVDLYRRAAAYVDRILRGAKPAGLPVEQPTKFELVVNLKTAKALGLTIPEAFLLRADQVIE